MPIITARITELLLSLCDPDGSDKDKNNCARALAAMLRKAIEQRDEWIANESRFSRENYADPEILEEIEMDDAELLQAAEEEA